MRLLRSLFIVLAISAFGACGALDSNSTSGASVTPEAADGVQVGIVISSPEGGDQTYFVTLDSESPTALEALQASEAEIVTQTSDFGDAICAINGVGYTANNCFGDLATGPFWAFFVRQDGAWSVAQVGVSLYSVQDGDVLGFSFSGFDENFNPTQYPTSISLGEIAQN